MASSTVHQTNSTSVVIVDSAGRVGASSGPVCKKLKLQQTERPSTDTNKQTVKSNDDLMPNRQANNIPKVFHINKKFVLQSAFKDWKNSFVPDEDGNFPLHKAVIDEDLNQVKRQCYVLEAHKESVDIQNAEKQTPLHLAVMLGFPQIVQTLLKFGERPENVDCKGNNALHLAIEETDNFACLQILLSECNGEPFINTLNNDGFSPLHLCAITGKCEESLALIEKGADTNLRNAKSGGTALFHADQAGNWDVSRLLVQNGASTHVPNYAGQTPMSLSVGAAAAVTGPVI